MFTNSLVILRALPRRKFHDGAVQNQASHVLQLGFGRRRSRRHGWIARTCESKKKVFAVNAVMAAGILILAIFWGVMLIERGIAAFLSLAGFTQFQFFPLPLDKKQRTSCVWILETPTNRLVTLGSAIPHPGCLIPGYELTQPCETAF